MTSRIVAKAVPSGGVITLNIAATGIMTLSRAIAVAHIPGAYTVLYTGPWTPFFVDIGDPTPGPLDPTNSYVYKLDDDNGSIVTPEILPTQALAVQTDPLTRILQRTIQGAVNNLVLPPGIKLPTVTLAMPMNGLPPLPLITINLNILQQEQIPVGQSAWVPDQDGNIIVDGQASRAYQVSILAYNAVERDFYRDVLIGVFHCFCGAILQPAGIDVTHKYQVASNQVSNENSGKSPGFYYADLMLDFTGSLNITISTDYTYIQTIDFSAYTPDGAVTSVEVPLAN